MDVFQDHLQAITHMKAGSLDSCRPCSYVPNTDCFCEGFHEFWYVIRTDKK